MVLNLGVDKMNIKNVSWISKELLVRYCLKTELSLEKIYLYSLKYQKFSRVIKNIPVIIFVHI